FGEFQVIDHEIDPEILKEVVYIEQQSTHPIADAIVSGFKEMNLDSVDHREPVEEIAGSGIKKGEIIVGKPSIFDTYNDPHNYRAKITAGYTTVFVGTSDQIVGYFTLADQIRDESAEAVAGFQAESIKVSLITGDNERVAKKVANEVNVDDYFANCLPEDKIKFVQNNQANNQVVGMIGDGI